MAVSKILLSGLTGAVVGTVAITAGNLPTNPGVGIGIGVAIVIYFLLLAISNCRGSRPKKAQTASEGKSEVQTGQDVEAKEKAKKKKKKKPASQKKPADVEKPKSPPPPQDEDEEDDKEEDGDKKLSKTQLRRQRIRKKKEAAEAQGEKAKEAARLKQIQDKEAKEAAKKAAQQVEAENKAKKQKKGVDEDGWEVQKVKERKEKKVQPVKPDASRGQEQKAGTAGPVIERVKGTVSVPRNLVGVVIGPQGINIKAITEKTGVRITTPKEDNFGPVILEGVDEKSVQAAKAAIESIVKTGMSNITHPGSTTNKIQLSDSKQVGILIGPKGANIQKLQSELKVSIKTPERDAVKFTVTVTGAKEKVKEAKDAIQDLIHLGYSKITHPDYDLLEVSYPSGSFGKLIGPKGQNIKSIQGNTKCRVNIPKSDNPRFKPDTVILVGPKAKLESAKKQVLNTLVEKEYYTEDYGDPNDPNYEGPDDGDY